MRNSPNAPHILLYFYRQVTPKFDFLPSRFHFIFFQIHHLFSIRGQSLILICSGIIIREKGYVHSMGNKLTIFRFALGYSTSKWRFQTRSSSSGSHSSTSYDFMYPPLFFVECNNILAFFKSINSCWNNKHPPLAITGDFLTFDFHVVK